MFQVKRTLLWFNIIILTISLVLPQIVDAAPQEFRNTVWQDDKTLEGRNYLDPSPFGLKDDGESGGSENGQGSTAKHVPSATKVRIQNAYGKLPLRFEKNEGQTDSKVKFLSRGNGYSLFLTPTESVLTLTKPREGKEGYFDKISTGSEFHRKTKKIQNRLARCHPRTNGLCNNPEVKDLGNSLPLKKFRNTAWNNNEVEENQNNVTLNPKNVTVRLSNRDHNSQEEQTPSYETIAISMKVVGANPNAKVAGQEELPGKTNYLIGKDQSKWRTGVSNYKKVKYEEVYPGIDLVYYGNQRKLEYDFVVKPGVDLKVIALKFDGIDGMTLDDEGNLVLQTGNGEVIQQKPIIYQEVHGQRQPIEGKYSIQEDNRVAFLVSDYDKNKNLVIDPILQYSTYLGGTDSEFGRGIAVDNSGNIYVVGDTKSTGFPTISGAYQTNKTDSSFDVFVVKLNSTGSALVYSTYIGGNDQDRGYGIAIDNSGNAYITGLTVIDFPTTAGAFLENPLNNFAGFVAKLNPSGSDLIYSTYLGGTSGDNDARSIAVDDSGNAYVTGVTFASNFPTTSGGFQTTNNGSGDVFIIKLNSTGSGLIYSTLAGGVGEDRAFGIDLGTSGNAYVTGYTKSTDFPVTSGAYQTTFGNGPQDAFILRLNSDGSNLVYSTYVGGHADEVGTGIAVDNSENAYITGFTQGAYPITSGVFQSISAGPKESFVTKINSSGSSLIYSTYIGGINGDFARAIELDNLGNAYITGETWSYDSYPTTPGAFATAVPGVSSFLSKLNTDGSSLLYSTYVSGGGFVYGTGIAVDSLENAYIVGHTSSNSFPTTEGAFQESKAGSDDAIIYKVNFNQPIVTAPGNIILEATGPTTSVDLGIASAIDPQEGDLTPTSNMIGPFAVGIHTVTWSVTDSDGNIDSAPQIVTITDTTAPTVNPPEDITVFSASQTTLVTLGTATATDVVDGALTPTADNTGPFTIGVHTVTWSTIDSAGNIGTAYQTVIINAGYPPVVTPPLDVTVEATGPTSLVTLGTAVATDQEDGVLIPTVDNSGPFAIGVHTVTWSVTDSDGNTGSATQTVTITDSTIPTVIPPADVTLEATGPTTSVNIGLAVATDPIDGNLIPTADNLGPFAVGTHTITWTATDPSGNSGMATQTLTIIDTIPPIINPPTDILVVTMESAISVNLGTATATDIVDGTLTPIVDNIGPFAIGVYTITWSATDTNNNTGTATQTVTVSLPSDLGETSEIQFTSDSAQKLRDKANELGSAVKIYEYVRNNYEYQLYHGSISGSINSFLAKRGNDVDLATTLIAMLRSQGIPARYAVGNVTLKKEDLMNWLNVKNFDLAVSILRDQGIQGPGSIGPEVSADGNSVTFERIWVQALVSYEDYRGIGSDESLDCAGTFIPDPCLWVDLDPAFKLRKYHNQRIDIYGQVQFDYDRYFHAIRNNDIEYKDKNPLEIYKQEILEYLRIHHPGKTLEDVKDPGLIIKEELELLPASLPFETVGEVKTYDSTEEHDLDFSVSNPAGLKKWQKKLKFKLKFEAIDINLPWEILLSDASYQKLSLSFVSSLPGSQSVVARFNGIDAVSPYVINININGQPVVQDGAIFNLQLEMDGPPAIEAGGIDDVFTSENEGLIVGGYYHISTGGYSSNWSQVHRATEQLLTANDQYPILNDASDIPYVDENENKIIDPGELPLLDHDEAQEALTGGLLYVAGMQFWADFYEKIQELGAIDYVISPIRGFAGIVSSTNEVEYLDGTTFAIMPGGLLVDMSSYSNGDWRINEPEKIAGLTNDLQAHIGSSLEHEVWQQMTGYDAVSTVRGIQMALAQDLDNDGQFDARLLHLKKTATEDTFPAAAPHLGFTSQAPPNFERADRFVFSTRPSTWSWEPNPDESHIFLTFKSTIDSSDSDIRRLYVNYFSEAGDSVFPTVGIVPCFDYQEDLITSFSPGSTVTGNYCGGEDIGGVSREQTLIRLEEIYTDYTGGAPQFEYFDRSQGFVPSENVYRLSDEELPSDYFPSEDVMNFHYSIYPKDPPDYRLEFVIPSRLTVGPTYRFKVFNGRQFNSNDELTGWSMSISNMSFTANGGYVAAEEELKPEEDTTGQLFDNELFNNETFVGLVNNDEIRTPSTVDPVSTVTGNMYLDETDIAIKGRGLNVGFTRTYNSGQIDLGDGKPFSKGWTHSYNMKLRSNDFGQHPNYPVELASENENNLTSSITYTNERGGEANYLVNDLGSYAVTPPKGFFDDLQLDTPSMGYHTLTFRNGTKYVFYSGNNMRSPGQTARLDRIEDPYGNQLSFQYDGSGNLTAITDNLNIAGRTGLSLTYSGDRLASITDWTGREWTYDYDAQSRLSSITDPLGNIKTYSYDGDSNFLNEEEYPADRNGEKAKTNYTYYENGKTFNNANALGQGETIDYDLYRKSTRVTDADGFVRTYRYDQNGALLQLEEPDGGILFFDNSEDSLRYQKTDALGFVTQYSYRSSGNAGTQASDNFGRVSREIDPLGFSTQFEYGLFDQPSHVVNKRGHASVLTYFETTDSSLGAVAGKLQREEILFEDPNAEPVETNNGNYTDDDTVLMLHFDELNGTFVDSSPSEHVITAVNGATTVNAPDNPLNPGSNAGSFDGIDDGLTIPDSEDWEFGNGDFTIELWFRLNETSPGSGVVKNSGSFFSQGPNASVGYFDFGYDGQGNTISFYDQPGNTFSLTIGAVFAPNTWYHMALVRDGIIFRYFLDGIEQGTKISNATLLDHTGPVSIGKRSYQTNYSQINGQIEEFRVSKGVARWTSDFTSPTTPYTAPPPPSGINTVLAEYTYTPGGNLETKTDFYDPANPNKKRVTTYTYDADDFNPTQVTVTGYPEGETVTVDTTYDALGRKLTERLNRRNSYADETLLQLTSTFEYDALGRVIAVTDTLGNVARTVYDANGQVTQESVDYKQTDASFVTRIFKTYEYDVAERLIKETDIDGNSTQYAYDARGNVISATDANGNVTRFEYDAMNRQTVVIDANGARRQTVYDLNGRVTQTVDGNGTAISFEYDGVGQTTKIITALNNQTQMEYDGNGNLTKTTDAEGRITTHEYDELNRRIKTTDANNGITAFTYDLQGNRTSLTDAEGHTTSFVYDGLGRLTEVKDPLEEDPEDKSTVFTYDEAGNVLTAKDRNGNEVGFAYDTLNRLFATVFVNDNAQELRTYDSFGNLKQVANEDIIYSFTYDQQNRLISKTDERLDHNGASTNKILSWSYDKVGNVVTKTDYQGKTTNYQYNAANRLIAQSNSDHVQVSYYYDEAGRLVNRILSNDVKSFYQYDADNRLTSLINQGVGGVEISRTLYTYDKVGNIKTVSVGAQGAEQTTVYTYDNLNRLLGVDAPNTANDHTYVYDKVGNRLTHNQDGVAHAYAYNVNNQLIEVRQGSMAGPVVYTYTYDSNGNRLTKRNVDDTTLQSFVYDQKNRVTGMSVPDKSFYFKYDPSDYRIKNDPSTGSGQVSAGGTRNYYLEGEHLEAIYDRNFQLQDQYFRGVVVDEVVHGLHYDADGNESGTTYHHDHLRSVTSTVGSLGSTSSTMQYGPFGELITETGNDNGNRLHYTGRELDDSGLYYYRARYYDPEVGRFTTEDPIGFKGGINKYAYVGNNPINGNDPSGQARVELIERPIDNSPTGNHAVIVVTDLDGSKTLYEGFPEAQLNNNQTPTNLFGDLTAVVNQTNPKDLAGLPSQVLVDDNLPGNVYTGQFNVYNQQINQSNISYNPLSTNSNAYAFSAVEQVLGVRPNSQTFSPGSTLSLSNQIPFNNGLQSPQFSSGAEGFFDGVSNFFQGLLGLSSSSSSSGGNGAGGGFVIYPNKPNNNFMESVYSK